MRFVIPDVVKLVGVVGVQSIVGHFKPVAKEACKPFLRQSAGRCFHAREFFGLAFIQAFGAGAQSRYRILQPLSLSKIISPQSLFTSVRENVLTGVADMEIATGVFVILEPLHDSP
jgi:hypothetical protein